MMIWPVGFEGGVAASALAIQPSFGPAQARALVPRPSASSRRLLGAKPVAKIPTPSFRVVSVMIAAPVARGHAPRPSVPSPPRPGPSVRSLPRPRATRDHHRLARDAAALGHGGCDPSPRGVEAAHGAISEDHGAGAPRSRRDGRGGLLRFGPAIGRAIERGLPIAAGSRDELLHLRPGEHSGIDLIGLRVLEPALIAGEIGF